MVEMKLLMVVGLMKLMRMMNMMKVFELVVDPVSPRHVQSQSSSNSPLHGSKQGPGPSLCCSVYFLREGHG